MFAVSDAVFESSETAFFVLEPAQADRGRRSGGRVGRQRGALASAQERLLHRCRGGLCTLNAAPLAAQQAAATPRTTIDVSKLGPQVGRTVPDFSLSDQNGKAWTRASIMGPKGALLLFYRSADWCPYCKTQLIDLQSRLSELRARGLGVAAISYDPVPTLAEFATRKQITF